MPRKPAGRPEDQPPAPTQPVEDRASRTEAQLRPQPVEDRASRTEAQLRPQPVEDRAGCPNDQQYDSETSPHSPAADTHTADQTPGKRNPRSPKRRSIPPIHPAGAWTAGTKLSETTEAHHPVHSQNQRTAKPAQPTPACRRNPAAGTGRNPPAGLNRSRWPNHAIFHPGGSP